MKTLTNAELTRAHAALVKLAQQPMPLWLLSQFADLLDTLTDPLNDYYDRKSECYKNDLENGALEAGEAITIQDPIILPLDCDICLSYTDLQSLRGLIELGCAGGMHDYIHPAD